MKEVPYGKPPANNLRYRQYYCENKDTVKPITYNLTAAQGYLFVADTINKVFGL
ncbi:hypothetical protein [Vibrio owensii]|uniref:hypothetical protein n=1 Tax=Vibrio owensii TaxID=696485 RepID=UPI0003AA99F3|nr:hypothetical protein [Vibrio owensii]